MTRFAAAFSSVVIAAAALLQPLAAQQPAARADKERPSACAILTRAEVKKIVPWPSFADKVKETEEPYGTGTVCSYPSVDIWLGKYSASRIEGARKLGPLTPVPDVAPDALLHLQGSSYVGLYIRLGDRLVHVQAPIGFGETTESVKGEVIALGKAVVAKLR